jgi:uncharacterized protein (DUF58 family)
MHTIEKIGGLRLALLGLALMSIPLVFFADMQPRGIGVMTAYVVPSLAVILFFVLMLDALMNRVFMIEQPPDVRAQRQVRMRLTFGTAIVLLLVWGSYFRTLLPD